MNASKQFTFKGKQLSESEFIREVMLSCYLIYSVLRTENILESDAKVGLANVKLLQSYLDSLEGLDLTGVELIKLGHYRDYSKFHATLLEQHLRESRRVKWGALITLTLIAIVVTTCFIVSG